METANPAILKDDNCSLNSNMEKIVAVITIPMLLRGNKTEL
jgi:hypothetical protein